MPILTDYQQFSGRHWETGAASNHFAYRGFVAPHTGKPYSEALFLGVSGGAAMGYFSFAYEGHDPMARILTRNTFDPWMTMLSRLGVVQNVMQTAKPERGEANVIEALEDGVPPIVWADMFTLPYNVETDDPDMWAMFPIVVFGYDAHSGEVRIADRARLALTCTTGELATARGRVKKDKYRSMTLEAPDVSKLASAVTAGIEDCIKLYTEAPPKGTKQNFGLAAFRNWADLLMNPKARLSWAKVFPPGRAMIAGLKTAYADIRLFGKDGFADRDMYADFLDEAALILNRPTLSEAAGAFRATIPSWERVAGSLLPDSVDGFGELRRLLTHGHDLFLNEGNASVPTRLEIKAREAELTDQLAEEFPLDTTGVAAFREQLATDILALHDAEETAIRTLQVALG